MSRHRPRHARDDGFTLIELLVAVAVIGILLVVAVPAYLGFQAGAQQRSAAAAVRSAVPHAAQFHAEHGSYVGMTVAALLAFDSGLDIDHVKVLGGGASYCLDKTVAGKTAMVTHGDAPVDGGKVIEGAGVC
jgi:prepilin-type N-terminal cleavage/methylation domain-containing protein